MKDRILDRPSHLAIYARGHAIRLREAVLGANSPLKCFASVVILSQILHYHTPLIIKILNLDERSSFDKIVRENSRFNLGNWKPGTPYRKVPLNSFYELSSSGEIQREFSRRLITGDERPQESWAKAIVSNAKWKI